MTLAAAWGARASICTTVGQERANLRLLGVTGVDRAGRPLAGAAVDRFVAGRVDRLAAGIILPFVAALAEYDLSPQALALDVASGAVDLGLESEILHDAARRADVEAMAADLAASAFERIDANRTARLELLAVIGDAARPWVGVTTAEPESADGAREAGLLVAAGVDVVRVDVPASRELADRLHDAGFELLPWRARPGVGQGARIRRRRAASAAWPRSAWRSTRRPPNGGATLAWRRRRCPWPGPSRPWSPPSSGSTSSTATRSPRSSTATSIPIGPWPTMPSPTA